MDRKKGSKEGSEKKLKSNPEVDKMSSLEVKDREERKRLMAENPKLLQISSLWFKDSELAMTSREAKPLVRCVHNIEMKDLIRLMYKRRKLKLPTIVLSVISNIDSLNNWTNQKQIQNFKKGLMKAAEDTNMWIIANACDIGSTNIIGDAISQYITEAKYKSSVDIEESLSKFTFIGVADEEMIKYNQRIASSDESKIEVPNENLVSGEGKHVLNPNLTHYLLIKDETINKNGVNTFLNNLFSFLSNTQIGDKGSDDLALIETSEVPVVLLVIKGGFNSSRLVLNQIRNRLPVVVLKGSGGLADLLAFCETELRERGFRDSWDPEFIETYLKPELTLRIIATHPHFRDNLFLCNQFRNRILESVRESSKEGQNYLNVINLFDSYSTNLENLTEHLLLALFQSQKAEVYEPLTTSGGEVDSKTEPTQKTINSIIKNDLTLCVDWNCPVMAKKHVLSKDPNFSLNSEKRLFERSLLRSNRLEFVDLFLNQKFKLRTFVSPKLLSRLFRKIHLNPFFAGVCWEGILGRSRDVRQSSRFLSQELNWLVEACTGIGTFFDEEELGLYITRQYPFTEKEAERKALQMIVFWAILDFKKDLVKVLFSHSDQPIHLALIIAMSYERLSWYVVEQGLSDELKEEMKLFVGFALKVLDKCNKDSTARADRVLNEINKDWNYKSPVDLAAFGKLRQFFDHQSCQRWLTNKFYGNIEIRDLRFTWFRLPVLIKLLLSAYLVLPAYLWVRITNNSSQIAVEEEVDDEEDESDPKLGKKSKRTIESAVEPVDSRVEPVDSRVEPVDSRLEMNVKEQSDSSDIEDRKRKPTLRRIGGQMTSYPLSGLNAGAERLTGQRSRPPPWTLMFETWNAPVTKFWNHQLFFTFYLSTFSVTLLYPKCGNFWLDLTIAIWTALLMLDDIRQTYLLAVRTTNFSIVTRVIEIAFVLMFLMVYISGRLLSNGSLALMNPYNEKIMMCLALLHAYYTFFTVFLPISATLGPLLYRLKVMFLVDFLNFIRLSILVMISFGVVIQAALYPDFDMNMELFRKTFHRSFFSLFLTPADELIVNDACDPSQLRLPNSTEECVVSRYTNPECRVTGFWPYFFESVYFILLKLILSTLLFAMFATSAQILSADTDTIWRFQRYRLVMDFVARGPIPPPLNVFYYIYLIGKWFVSDVSLQIIRDPKKFRDFLNLTLGTTYQNRLLEDYDYTYLKGLSSQTYEDYRSQKTPNQMANEQWERIKVISEEMEYERQALRVLKGKMSEMERSNQQTIVYLESIKHLSTKPTGIEDISRRALHVLSRRSPYPNTSVQRYPVPDKYVSWDVLWVEYDPIAYTKFKEDFGISLRDFADEDLLVLQMNQLEQPNQSLPVLDWNRVSVSAVGATTDRQSWEQLMNEPILYKLDKGIPVNPFGRTGLRGKGSLLRWGPNHFVMIVITRKVSNSLEVLIEKLDLKSNAISLILRFIPGECTYVGIEKLFKPTDAENKNWNQFEKVTNFFKMFAETEGTEDKPKESSFKFEQLIRGYFDDPLNTDQAWKETELWHFHYTNKNDNFNNFCADSLEWREVTESLFTLLTLSQSNVIQIIVDKLKVGI